MSSVVNAMSHLFSFPETLEKFMLNSSRAGNNGSEHRHPVDILDSPKEYVFYMDVPGLSKSDIQVSVEDENTLVIRSNGKRRREDGEEDEGCKYMRFERRTPQKLTRKFRLPENSDVSSISAKCENGVLTVIVQKLPPPPKSKTLEVAIS